MRDLYGRVVPKRLEPIFIGELALRRIVESLWTIGSELSAKRHEPYMRDIDLTAALRHLGAATSLLNIGRPTLSRCICPPDEMDCPYCRGGKWVSERARLAATNAGLACE